MEGQTLLHVKCFFVQKLSQENCVPKSCRNKQTFCCRLGVYSAIFDMITESGILDKKLWRSLEARHTASFMRAIPESNNSDTANAPYYNIFCDQYLNVWTYKYQSQRVQMGCRGHVQKKRRWCLRGKSALRELSPPTIAFLGNVTHLLK